MLYSLVTFVGLFIVATALAVVFYVKSEDQIQTVEKATNDLRDMVSNRQEQNITKLIGTKKRNETYVGKMLEYFDTTVLAILGAPVADTSAEIKIAEVRRKIDETLDLVTQQNIAVQTVDANTTGLLRIAKTLNANLDNKKKQLLATEQQLNDLQKTSSDTQERTHDKEQKLQDKKDELQKQVDTISKEYDELKALTHMTADQQVADLTTQLNEQTTNNEQLTGQLMKTRAQLRVNQDKMKRLQEDLWKVTPPPDKEVPAYKPDGKVTLIDNQIVHLNIGTEDKVYRSLTFSIYDKGVPIPKNGKGKAEVEVFDVGKNVSQARIISSEKRNPIVQDDIVANLVWDSDKTNIFVATGQFDLNGDGRFDDDATEKLKVLVEKWGGKIAQAVTVETDYLILGKPPTLLRRPTFDEMEADPMAMEKYEASKRKLEQYELIEQQAKDLWIPVFNTERFLYFIGYKSLAPRPGAF